MKYTGTLTQKGYRKALFWEKLYPSAGEVGYWERFASTLLFFLFFTFFLKYLEYLGGTDLMRSIFLHLSSSTGTQEKVAWIYYAAVYSMYVPFFIYTFLFLVGVRKLSEEDSSKEVRRHSLAKTFMRGLLFIIFLYGFTLSMYFFSSFSQKIKNFSVPIEITSTFLSACGKQTVLNSLSFQFTSPIVCDSTFFKGYANTPDPRRFFFGLTTYWRTAYGEREDY